MDLASKSTGALGRKAPGSGNGSLDCAGIGPGIAPAGTAPRSRQRSGEGKPLQAREARGYRRKAPLAQFPTGSKVQDFATTIRFPAVVA